MYRRKTRGWLKHLDFIVLDFVILEAMFSLATLLYKDIFHKFLGMNSYIEGMSLLAVADILIILVFNSYKGILKRGYVVELWETIKHVALVGALYLALLFAIHDSDGQSRVVTGATILSYLLLDYTVRCFYKRHLRRKRITTQTAALMLVCASENVNDVLERFHEHNYERYLLAAIAIIDDIKPAVENKTGQSEASESRERMKIGGIPVIHGQQEAIHYACREWIDEALIVLPEGQPCEAKFIAALQQMGIVPHTVIAKRENDNEVVRQQVETVADYVVLTYLTHDVSAAELFLKRAMDIVGGLIGTFCMLIMALILTPIIKIQSPGPVFFQQQRVGKNGKKFYMLKFRSMYMDAEERKAELIEKNRVADGYMFKLDEDPRIIGSKILPDGTYKKGIGNFMREHSIDEFPQFLNVLKGDMSLVGTRPPLVDEWEKYQLYHRSRMATKPGITGLWQVSGRSKITDFDEVVRLDNQYIANWTIGMDCRILLKTIKFLFTRQEDAL